MHRLLMTLLLVWGMSSCRSTVKPNPSAALQAERGSLPLGMPLALGDGYSCVLNKKGQGFCQGTQGSAGEAPAGWQSLRAAGSAPVLKHLVARGSVTCAVGSQPASLDNRILCWQPQTLRTPASSEQDAILLSGKLPGSIRALALQKNKVCALFSGGQASCGDLLTQDKALILNPVPGLRLLRSLKSGDSFSCGIRSDTGAIFCWGDNSQGQLGLGSMLARENEPVAIAGFSGFAIALETGAQHACAINRAGEVQCWGLNRDQQTGAEGDVQKEPQVVRGLPAQASSLALGQRHSCAQLTDGSVFCWGQRAALGAESQGGLIPVRVPLPARSVHVIAHEDRSCAQLISTDVFCWGLEPNVFMLPP